MKVLTTCDCCDGDGGFESAPYGYEPRDGSPLTRWIECIYCAGSGWIEREPEPMTEDDLPPPYGEPLP